MITSQPLGNTDLTPGGNTTLSVVASGNPGYQWQELIGGGLWSNLTNGGVFNGVTTPVLSITGATLIMNGNQYRVIVTRGCGAPISSSPLTLSVTSANASVLTLGNGIGCQGDTLSIPLTVTRLNSVTDFSFKINLPIGTSFLGLTNLVSGFNSATATVSGAQISILWNGSSYSQLSGSLMNLRLVLGSQGGNLAWDSATTMISSSAFTNVNGFLNTAPLPAVVNQPISLLTVGEFSGVSISTVTSNSTEFQWQKRNSTSSQWVDLVDDDLYSGTSTEILTFSSVTINLSGYQYRLKLKSNTCPNLVYSSICTMSVIPMQIDLSTSVGNSCFGDTIIVPIRVSGANSISAMNVLLQYDTSKLDFLPFLSDSLLNSNILVRLINAQTPSLLISYTAGLPLSLNQATIVRLHFRAKESTNLTWSINQEFLNINSIPVSNSQINKVNASVVIPRATFTISGSTSFCTGDSVQFVANPIIGASYQWLDNYGPINGATSPTFSATNSGSYRLLISTASGCMDTSASISVTTWSLPVALISPTGPTIFCPGGQVVLNATQGHNNTYRWYRDNMRLPISIGQESIVAIMSGTYRVVVVNAEGCSDSTASGILVTVKDKPQPPVISRPTTAPGWDSLFTNIRNQGNITWFFNGSPLQGGQDGVLRMVNNGVYQALQDSVGCQSDLSNAILYQCSVVILNHPSNQNALLNQNIQLNVLASLPNMNYQWQSDIGFGFQNLGNAGQYSGVQTPNLVISRVTQNNHRHFFRCIVSSSVCGSDTSDMAELTVSTAPNVGGVPQRFTYQSVLRDSLGQLLANQPVNIRLTLQRGPAMVALYSETHSLTTNANGLLSCIVGDGQVLLGSMDSIEWSLGQVYLKTEFTYNGSSNFSILSNRELLSVPYALYALQSGSGGGSPGPQGPVGPQGPAGPQGPPGTGGGGAGVLATVRTLGASVRYTGALVEGSLDSDGGELVLSRGICADTLPSPGTSKAVPHAGTGMGAYTVDLTGLTPGRTYHVRAYATTAAGTAFGQSLTLQTRALAVPAPVTLTATGLSAFGAQVRGELPDTSIGGLAVSSRGFRLSTASGFAPAAGQDLASQASAGTGYSAQVTGLSPSTNYYCRAYAVNALGTGYGQELSFSTGNQPLATVQTQAASSITQTQALVAGAVTADAGSAVSERGFCYSTQNSPLITSDTIRAGSGLGTFNGTLRNLTPNTTYYFRSYAVNGGGVAYGLVLSLQTPVLALASINTRAVYGISNTIAYSGGTVTSDGGSSITQRGVVFDTVAGPTLTSNQTNDGTGTGSYTSLMTGLAPSTTYYVRAYANNALGTAYGNELSFITTAQASGPSYPPSVLTQPITKTDSTHLMGGVVVDGGNSPITAQGICWNRTGAPTVSDSVRYFTPTGTGTYTLMVDLPHGCNETFYVRAFAQNSAGVGYGQRVITTNGFAPKIGNSQLTQIGATTATLQTTILDSGGCAVLERGVCWSTSPNPTAGNALFRTACGADTGQYSCQLTNLVPQTIYYVRAYMNNVTGTYYGPEQTFTTDTTSALYIGQPYAGGIIFDLDSSGQHGLVCAPGDQGNFVWGCYGTNVPNTSTAFGTGLANTSFITYVCSDRPIAASVCSDLVLNGYSDWYLPSLGELQTMYNRLHLQGLGGFGVNWYWSSSQYGRYNVWGMYFGNGDVSYYSGLEEIGSQVRAVRAF
jgi:hypothetical protein